MRHLFSSNRPLLLWMGVAMLCVRMLAPAGFMPDYDVHGLALRMCPATTVAPAPTTHAAMPGMGTHDVAAGHSDEHEGQPEQPCGFVGLTMPLLAAGDPVWTVLVLPVEQVGSSALLHSPSLAARTHLWPPSVGPPTQV